MFFSWNRTRFVITIAAAFTVAACHRHNDNHAPNAVISMSQPSAEQVTTYAFSAAGSADADGRIVAQQWDFGDGSKSTDASPTHMYGASGSYTVTLTVTDDDGASASATRTVDITTPAVSVLSGSAAFSVSLPQVAIVEVPAASFSAPTHVGVWTTSTAATAADFELTSQMFRSPLRAVREIRINTGRVQASNALRVIANLPAELAARLQANDEPRVFVQVFEDGGDEVLDNFELIDAVYDAASKTLRFDLPPAMFTDRRSADETWEAVIVVGSTRTKPASSAAAAQRAASGQLLDTEQVRPWPALAVPGLFGNQQAAPSLPFATAQAACDGATLQPPLASLTVTGPFNPPGHYGVDYRAADGTEVRAMATGTVRIIGFDERPLSKPDPRSGKLVKGWGRYIVIEHEDGSKSLYAHLQKDGVRVGADATVSAGDVIALSDNSGGSQAPHLHVEYAPNGEIFKKPSKVNADACVGSNVTGNVQVRDNGDLADDAFAVAVNGRTICTTSIGASNSCALGALRAGTATLSITATIAPDDVGTYEITLSGGLRFQDGSVTVSGTLPQGGSASFGILIP